MDGADKAPTVPVFAVTGETAIDEALLVGSFPHPFVIGKENDPPRGGFDVDYLAAVGGEANPRLDGRARVPYAINGEERSAPAVRVAKDQMARWEEALDRPVNAVAYAVVDLRAEADGEWQCLFGSDDYAKVWCGGALVHEVWRDDGRALWPEQETFTLPLKKGLNRLVFKIEQKHGDWGMDVKVLDAEAVAARRARQAARRRFDRFRFDRLLPFDALRQETMPRLLPLAAGDRVPSLAFGNPELAAELADLDTLTVRWFDADANEIDAFRRPGFHCAYLEVKAKNGLTLRRAVPVYVPEKPDVWRDSGIFDRFSFAWNQRSYPPFPEAVWNERRALAADTAEFAWGTSREHDPIPMLWGELALDRDPADAWRESYYAHVHDYLVRLRRKVLDRPAPKTLPPPADDPDATALRPGTEAQAGMKPGAADAIRAACRRWRDETGLGFVAVVARRGVVVLHEAFPGREDADHVRPAELDDGVMTVRSRLETASVTKLHAGALLGRFLDQGWVDLDDPAARFLPDLPDGITVRQLMNHTAGLDGHRWFMGLEGMANPFLDNVARWDLELSGALPGREYRYNGFGIDLGGKVVEDIAGTSAFRAMRDGLFAPLGQDRPFINDLGYGLCCTAMDLARMAEMLRQEGAYDGKRYFSRATFAKLLPLPLSRHNPAMAGSKKDDYGVGISWMRDPVPAPDDGPAAAMATAAGKAGEAAPEYIFGPDVFGHGSATGAVVRVARTKELVVAVARYTPGPDYDRHLARMLQAVADHLE